MRILALFAHILHGLLMAPFWALAGVRDFYRRCTGEAAAEDMEIAAEDERAAVEQEIAELRAEAAQRYDQAPSIATLARLAAEFVKRGETAELFQLPMTHITHDEKVWLVTMDRLSAEAISRAHPGQILQHVAGERRLSGVHICGDAIPLHPSMKSGVYFQPGYKMDETIEEIMDPNRREYVH